MPLHDTGYQHWQGVHRGIWRRRTAIAWNGLTACLRNKWTRHLVVLCWGAGLMMAMALFLVGQLLVEDSVVVEWVGNVSPQLQEFARTLTRWLEEHPEISVRTTQNVLFYYFGTRLLRVGIFLLGLAIPFLITRDLGSNAIVIYSSKAVSRGDYLLGKFATAFGLLTLAWLGPVLAGWLLGNLLSPDWRFFWHSRAALMNVLAYGLTSMTVLSVLALGVSAISSKEKSTTALWYVWWIIGGVIAPIAAQTLPWLRHISFNYNLDQMALAVFRLGDDIERVRANIPVFGGMLRGVPAQTLQALSAPAITGALLWSLAMMTLAVIVIRYRAKPE